WNRVQDRIPAQAARLLGVVVMVAALYLVLLLRNANARSLDTQQTIAENLGYFGLPTLGVGVLIVCSGIDLSIRSVVGLGAVCFGLMLEGPLSVSEVHILTVLGGLDVGLIAYLLLVRFRLRSWMAALAGLVVAVAAHVALNFVGEQFLLGRRFNPW